MLFYKLTKLYHKRFKMQVAKDGIPSEIKKRKFHEKPGVKKRNEKKENIKNAKKHSKSRY